MLKHQHQHSITHLHVRMKSQSTQNMFAFTFLFQFSPLPTSLPPITDQKPRHSKKASFFPTPESHLSFYKGASHTYKKQAKAAPQKINASNPVNPLISNKNTPGQIPKWGLKARGPTIFRCSPMQKARSRTQKGNASSKSILHQKVVELRALGIKCKSGWALIEC